MYVPAAYAAKGMSVRFGKQPPMLLGVFQRFTNVLVRVHALNYFLGQL